ncbi:DUF7524 family protein [Halonotius sp. GCM10025705]|uniref:DUF7524 family protein n=1 Tax=Halonotius sp. GCM10025705 TaxID=3252678 RepID=UPI003612A02C
MSQLTVSLNDDGLHSITAPDSFETSGPVELLLDNHGEAVHVHLNLDETLSAVADIRANNHYVEPESERPVSVAVNPRSAAVTGRLKIATGYGSEVAYTTITVKPPSEDPNRVTVDESLSKPQREPPAEPTTAEQPPTPSPAGTRLDCWLASGCSQWCWRLLSPSHSKVGLSSPARSLCCLALSLLSAWPYASRSHSLSSWPSGCVGVPDRLPSSSNRFSRRYRAR